MKRLWSFRNAVLVYILCFSAGALSAIVLTRPPVLEYIATPQFLGIATAGSSLVALLIALLGRAWSKSDRELDMRLRATPVAVQLVDVVRNWRVRVKDILEGCWERTHSDRHQEMFEENVLFYPEWIIPKTIAERQQDLWLLGSAARPIYRALRAIRQLNHFQHVPPEDPSFDTERGLALELAQALPGYLDEAVSKLEALAEC